MLIETIKSKIELLEIIGNDKEKLEVLGYQETEKGLITLYKKGDVYFGVRI